MVKIDFVALFRLYLHYRNKEHEVLKKILGQTLWRFFVDELAMGQVYFWILEPLSLSLSLCLSLSLSLSHFITPMLHNNSFNYQRTYIILTVASICEEPKRKRENQ